MEVGMTPYEFKILAAEAEAEEYDYASSLLDELCFQWLKKAMESSGREGQVGLDLLKVIKERCMP
jgi:hypothetical protein